MLAHAWMVFRNFQPFLGHMKKLKISLPSTEVFNFGRVTFSNNFVWSEDIFILSFVCEMYVFCFRLVLSKPEKY